MTVPNFGTPVRGAQPVRTGQAGVRPRAAPRQRKVSRAAERSGPEVAAGTAQRLTERALARDQVRNNPAQPAGSASESVSHSKDRVRPTVPNNATKRDNANRPQPQRTPPASRPAAQTQPAARPAVTRPQPQQQRPQPAAATSTTCNSVLRNVRNLRVRSLRNVPQPQQQRPAATAGSSSRARKRAQRAQPARPAAKTAEEERQGQRTLSQAVHRSESCP
jgi:hypothetical protein